MLLPFCLNPAPCSLLRIGYCPITATLPARLREKTTIIDCEVGNAPALPQPCAGLKAGERLDLVVACVSPAVLLETLRRLTVLGFSATRRHFVAP